MIRESDAPDGDEFTSNIVYRSPTARPTGSPRAGTAASPSGRDRVRDVRLEAEAMARDIGCRMGVEPAAIVEAVEDALAGRRPRW